MSATTRDKLEFVYAMAKHSDASIGDLQRLMRYASTHNRIATHHCNGDCPYKHSSELAGRETDDWCKKQATVETAITKLVHSFGALVHFGGDPRGCTVKVVVPDGYTNDFGREGVCVPTA